MSLASGSPEPIPTDIPPDPESGIEVAVVAYPEDTDAAVASGMLPAGKPRSSFRRGIEVFWENKLAVVGVGIYVFMILFCFVGPLIYHTNQLQVNFTNQELPPSAAHSSSVNSV